MAVAFVRWLLTLTPDSAERGPSMSVDDSGWWS
jgi:hypothetical protein